jgi:hypothetical protein
MNKLYNTVGLVVGVLNELASPDQLTIPALLRRGCRTSGRPGGPSTNDASSLPSPSGGRGERRCIGYLAFPLHARLYEC